LAAGDFCDLSIAQLNEFSHNIFLLFG